MKKNIKKGFTLIELLVVIAIIGILATVVIASLSSSRTKSKVAAAQSTMSSILPLAVTCMDDGSQLEPMTANTGGGVLCNATTATWPTITGGWTYDTAPTSDPVHNTFSFSASDDSGNSITCTDSNGCVTTLAS